MKTSAPSWRNDHKFCNSFFAAHDMNELVGNEKFQLQLVGMRLRMKTSGRGRKSISRPTRLYIKVTDVRRFVKVCTVRFCVRPPVIVRVVPKRQHSLSRSLERHR